MKRGEYKGGKEEPIEKSILIQNVLAPVAQWWRLWGHPILLIFFSLDHEK